MINQKIKKINLVNKNKLFDNYLFKLSKNEYVNNESPICIWGLSELLNKMYLDMRKNYEYPLLSLISSELDVKSINCRSFYHWINDEAPIPILKFLKFVNLWKKLCKKTKEEGDTVIQKAFMISNYFSTKRGKKVKLPNILTPELAYLIGYIAGDGYLLDPIKEKQTTGDFEFRIEITSGDEYILKKYIYQYFKKIFEIEGQFYKYKKRNAYEYYVSSKALFLFFNKICELPEGRKKNRLYIPQIILNSEPKIKAHFLAGFFDSDGYITVNKKIGFGLGEDTPRLLEEIKKLFKDLDINTRAITRLGSKILKGWEISISWDSLLTFIDKIPSKNIKKSKRLKKLKQTLLKK